MKKPEQELLNRCRIQYLDGKQVYLEFYNQHLGYGSIRVNHIPSTLENKHWKPEDGKKYKCWSYHTNPADPADSGENKLIYIEEIETYEVEKLKNKYKSDINTIVENLDLNELKKLKEYIEIYY